MWSESDPQYAQWALNPSAYQNVSHEQVDWAALAQQWIQMKDTCPPSQMPAAPPPPPLGPRPDEKKNPDIEGGEAPMDMDKEDVSSTSASQDGPAWGSWNNNWQQQQWGGWGWGTGGVAPPGGVPPPTPAALIGKQSGTLPMPGYNYNTTANSGFAPPAPGAFNYTQGPPGNGGEFNQVMVGGYWTAGPNANNSGNPALGQGAGSVPFIRNNRPYWAKRSNRNERNHSADNSEEEVEEEDLSISLDAAKRRQLPAWIREGLEKMEREKQKQIDRDRQIKEREIYLQKKREEDDALNELQSQSGQPVVPKKSKFESDSEESDNNGEQAPPTSSSKRKSRFRNADSPSSTPLRPMVKEPSPEPEPPKSKEEMLQETMLKVRRMLTEILLEVTTEEMESVVQEVMAKALKKAPAMQLRKTPALASLTGKLGLGIYGDSEDSDSGDESDRDSNNRGDSDEELKDQIERRKSEFTKTEREIEERLREEEEREKRMRGEASEDSDGEERQVENTQSDKRPKASDGHKIKEEPEDILHHHQDYSKHEEAFHVANKDHFNAPPVKREIKYEHITGRRSDKKGSHVVVKPVHKIKQEKVSSDDCEEATSKSDSESSSSSKSSSSAVKTSSPESRRSSKKNSKNGRSRDLDESNDRRRSSYGSDTKQKKSSEKSSSKLKDKKQGRDSRERKEKKKDKRDRSRSKESRRSKRSPSRESRRSRRSHSRESRQSKSSRRNGDVSYGKSGSGHRRYSSSSRGIHRSRDSGSKDRSYSRRQDSDKSTHKSSSKEDRNRRRDHQSRSPVREKRKHRDWTRSRSRSVSEKRGRYSRSRSSSTPAPRKKSSRATGKTAGH